MNTNKRRQILLTNDDGIESPGLWAAAEALSEIGFVTVVAPRQQSSGVGRSSPSTSDFTIRPVELQIGGQNWRTYAFGGTPAQSVMHGIVEIMSGPPDLVVSGINYGANLGDCITVSGTVGAALEAASMGVPSIAVSLEIDSDDYLSYQEFDFSTAAYFTRYFAEKMFDKKLPGDTQIIKLDIPCDATPETEWRITRMANYRYFHANVTRTGGLEESKVDITFETRNERDKLPLDSDVYAMVFDRVVAVTPLTLDMTARVDFSELTDMFQ